MIRFGHNITKFACDGGAVRSTRHDLKLAFYIGSTICFDIRVSSTWLILKQNNERDSWTDWVKLGFGMARLRAVQAGASREFSSKTSRSRRPKQEQSSSGRGEPKAPPQFSPSPTLTLPSPLPPSHFDPSFHSPMASFTPAPPSTFLRLAKPSRYLSRVSVILFLQSFLKFLGWYLHFHRSSTF